MTSPHLLIFKMTIFLGNHYNLEVCQMVQRTKAPTAKSGNLSFIPETHRVSGENLLLKIIIHMQVRVLRK